MTAPAPGQAAYEAWAAVLATNGVECEPFEKLGNVEQMAWREVEAIAAAAPAPASPGYIARDALSEIISAISEHDESDVKYPDELLVSIERIAELALVAERKLPQPAPELAAAMAKAELEVSAFLAEQNQRRIDAASGDATPPLGTAWRLLDETRAKHAIATAALREIHQDEDTNSKAHCIAADALADIADVDPVAAPGDLLSKRFFHLASELENEAAYTLSREASEAFRLSAQRIRKALDTDPGQPQAAPGDDAPLGELLAYVTKVPQAAPEDDLRAAIERIIDRYPDERPAPELAAATLRKLLGQILKRFEPVDPAEIHGRYKLIETAAMIEHWRKRAGLQP